ncbi:MlaD family protein [Patulibacter defluvii]|uniref:MlaD family protein n=1 Tax=Patulibacter defluvii TaxID=3095358 RepID=UPI002A756A0D|nr:MlaD family protein [Patulibacter sp. DM4]
MAQTTQGVWIERFGNVKAGIFTIALALIVVYFIFSKAIPFQSHYEVKAVVPTSNLIVPGSQVRIAGVNVGKVMAVGRYRQTNLAQITMRIDDEGRPIRRDAELKIRPKLFLEGNFYVDLRPGTPGTAELPSGGTIPVAQTATPVQLDQVLSPLRGNVRTGLQQTLQGFGDALGSKPTAAEDATQAPVVRGLTGGQAMNETLRSSVPALRDGAIVTDALRGTEHGDLARVLRGFGRAAGGLARDEGALTSLVRDFDTTVGATALHAAGLRATVRELAAVAATGRVAFADLRRALPPSRQLARALASGLDELPATIVAARPWLTQAYPLLGNAEFGGLARDLAPAIGNLAAFTHQSRNLVRNTDLLARCASDTLVPTAKLPVPDGDLSTGSENYKELWYAMVGQASEAQSFDGNGTLLRLPTIGGGPVIRSGTTIAEGKASRSVSPIRSAGTRPVYPGGRTPPLRRDVPCYRAGVPDLRSATGPADGSRPNSPVPSRPNLNPLPPEELAP